MIAWFLWVLWYFIFYLCRACLSFLSWMGRFYLGAVRVQEERAAVWVWEWQVDGCRGGHAENLEEWWMSAPLLLSLAQERMRKDLEQKEGLKLKGERYGPVALVIQAQLWHEQPYQTHLVLCFWKRIKRFHPLALALFVFRE